MEDKSLIRYIIGASRVKFDQLDELIRNHKDLVGVNFRNTFNMAVVMVDANSIFYRLYRDSDLAAVYADRRNELVRDLVVGFMNVLGHYRRYIATRLHLSNDIFVAFNMDPCKYQRSLVPDYGNKYMLRYDKDNPTYGFINEALRDAWKFIVSLSAYFEGIYCFDLKKVDEFSTILAAISPSDKNLYITFSRSPIPLQLLDNATQPTPNWFQLISKRDNSIFVDRNDCFEKMILADRKLRPHPKLSCGDLPYLWALSGCPYVSVGSTKYAKSIVDAIRIVNKAFDDGGMMLIKNMSFPVFCDSIGDYTKRSRIELHTDIPKLMKRFKAMNLYLSAGALSNDQRLAIKRNLVDMYDQTELEKLNDLLAQGSDDPNLLEIENLNMSTVE